MTMEAAKKVNNAVMETQWKENEKIIIDELDLYPFMLDDVRRLLDEQRRLADLRMERDMPALVHRYDGDPIQRTGVSDPMFNIAAATESIDKKLDALRLEQEEILARHTRLKAELDRMDATHATIIKLRHFDRYRWKQLAGRMGCEISQVRRLHREAIIILTKRMPDHIQSKRAKMN